MIIIIDYFHFLIFITVIINYPSIILSFFYEQCYSKYTLKIYTLFKYLE